MYRYPCGGLLPRLLTLTLAGGYFLLRYYTLTDIKPLTCVVLCVARTFLPHPKVAAIERKCRGKDNTKNWNVKTENSFHSPNSIRISHPREIARRRVLRHYSVKDLLKL